MLAHYLLLPPLLLCLPPRECQSTGGCPERSPEAPAPIATDPAPEQSDSRAAAEQATRLRSSEWMQQIGCEIERGEFFWSSIADGECSAPNRTQDLRSRIGPGGLEVFPRGSQVSGAGAPWRLILRTLAFGSEDDVRPLGEPQIARVENRIDLHYTALSEWYVNDERGIEQGWTIPAPPPDHAGSALRIEIETGGLRAEIAGDGRSAVFVDDASTTRLHYHGLRAWDASGRDLPARLRPTPAGLAIQVEAEDALYPITVDPVFSGSAWTAESNQAGAAFGWSVSGAGDVNGDGFDDVIIGAKWFDEGEADEGRAFLYLGSADGPSLAPAWTAASDQADADFGVSVSGAGDVNGDGFDDVIVGADEYDNGELDEGRAFLYLGSPGGLSLAPDWTAESDQAGARFGFTVRGAEDVNGDGFDDVIAGAHFFDNGQLNEGRAYVYLGSANGPSLTPDWTAESDQAGALFGVSVSGAGDVDGNGYGDVIIGAYQFDGGQADVGRALLYLGSASGLSLAPAWTAASDQTDSYFGWSVSGAGDVNGDGFDDVIVGASSYTDGQTYEGSAFLYLGSAAGPSLAANWTGDSDQAGASFGTSVSGAGDVNADGFDDVIVGAPHVSNGQTYEGRAFLYLGSAGGPSLAPDWTEEGEQGHAEFGISVSAAGDVDGDGLDDVIVGAWQFENGQVWEGRAYMYVTCPPVGTTYCIATVNSTGSPAEISAWCSARSPAGRLTLEARSVPNQFGIFFHGRNQAQVPFGNGFLCTTGDLVRGAVTQAAQYFATYTYDNSDAKHSLAAHAGTTRNFQFWFRDQWAGGAFFNTSNAVSIAILP